MDQKRILTGIPEFDVVLRGGLLADRIHLIEGLPGTGKTTFGLRFLLSGVQSGDACLYITLSETRKELLACADSHGWSTDGIEICELIPAEARLGQEQSVLFPSEVELNATIETISRKILEHKPHRVVIDSMTELRLLATEPAGYRRQIIALRQFLLQQHCTALLLDDLTSEPREHDLQGSVHGVISLEQRERAFGSARRRLRVVKMRGGDFQSGWHDFAIVRSEVLVFPSLIADEHHRDYERGSVSSGIDELDALLGGGLMRGTTTVLQGPTGVGKSSLALQYAIAGAKRGEHVAYFSFDETLETLYDRARGLNLDVHAPIESQVIQWERINPSRISPGEFIWKVRQEVEHRHARIVVIDSLNSYLETIEEHDALLPQLHELFTYLNHQGVLCILVLGHVSGSDKGTDPLGVTLISDAVILLHFFVRDGIVKKGITVVKKRPGQHECAIREYLLSATGIGLGERVQQQTPFVDADTGAVHRAAAAVAARAP
ncbi:ATPase domain-containing protein [Noviherbaspirillum sp. 1P10PC]|uniref:ATPase domain-containing protein n=1 Tax=Noviherbaspirillum sp. 1P10PC TaxID=3132292 RepID=UPI0039A27F18